MTEPKNEMSAEEQAAARKKAKAKIRTIRIWAWVILTLLAATALLSQCAMSKPQAKQNIFESCVKNIPFAEKWQNDLKERGLDSKQQQTRRRLLHLYVGQAFGQTFRRANPFIGQTQPAGTARPARRRASV